MTGQDYLNLVTSEHQGKPDFADMILSGVSPMVQVQNLMTSFNDIFDLDKPPVGDQLDIIGQWVGATRSIAIPIYGVYFSWDSGDLLGWEFGVWQDPNQQTALSTLPDDAYLVLIRAKIAANNWDGTTEGAYKIWKILFPSLNLLIQDYQNMSFVVAVQGSAINSLTLALLTQGYLPLRPEGVLITEYIVCVDSNPLFGWDIENTYVDGWGIGSWGREITPS